MSLDFTESEWQLFKSTIDFDSLPALPDVELELSMSFDPPIQLDITSSYSTNSEVTSTALVPRVRQEEIDVPLPTLHVEMRKR
jgi:hypothetical protein